MKYIGLPGGGPWRISPECSASRHCDIGAAHAGCTCPRARVVRQKELAHLREISRLRRVEKGGPDTGVGRGSAAVPRWFLGGPWKISPLCVARGHNNLTWARGGVRKNEAKCTCPHALQLFSEHKASRRVLDKAQRDERAAGIRVEKLSMLSAAPYWKGAACRENVAIADKGFNEDASKRGVKDRQEARALCGECPRRVFQQCKEWITEQEGDRPGMMGGVYAGMTPRDRREKREFHV